MENHKGSLISQAERLSEEGRLLLLLGRTLKRVASSPPDGSLGPWALNALQELKSLDSKVIAVVSQPRKTKSSKSVVEVKPGLPLVIWIASCPHQGDRLTLAVAADELGNKQLLSLQEGSTLNPLVSEALVNELTAQGLPGDGNVLVVTDGNQCLEDTMRLHWELMPAIAHCQSSVRKAVVAHLQGDQRRIISERLKKTWMLGETAAGALTSLVEELDRDHPGAAERLKRSLAATLVVDRLGVKYPLRDHLVVAGVPRMALIRAREWGGKNEAEIASGLETWLTRTRRLPGYRALPQLAESLRKLNNKEASRKEQAASQSQSSKTQPTTN